MTVHSTEDSRLPAPGDAFTWPIYNNVDYSRLGNWTTYLGFFERPTAHGPFAAVYDHAADAGIVRIFPPQVTRGSKAFGLGWQSPLPSDLYTDDGSSYVELHGGLAPPSAISSLCRRAASSVGARCGTLCGRSAASPGPTKWRR
ncbi:MAG: hypothetical protein R2873_03560 [Caldilineaceae bacterium]